MRRDLESLANDTFDLAVIGGGATGAFVAWDAANRGMRVALVEKNDFSHATSAGNSRLIHGGLRYLSQGHLKVVRDSVRERTYWLRAAPHLVRPLPFLFPAKSSIQRRIVGTGLRVYDFLGREDSSLLPPARRLTADEARAMAPCLGDHADPGAWLYHDAQMHAPERLVLSALIGTVELGATVANRVEALRVQASAGKVEGVVVRDVEGDGAFLLRAPLIVNACGPWGSRFLGDKDPELTLSSGLHVVTRSLTRDVAVAVKDSIGHFFLLPWRSHTLIGTTDERFEGSPDSYAVTRQESLDFLRRVSDTLPAAGLGPGDIMASYGGLRTLLAAGGNTYSASREAEIIDHADSERRGLYSLLGGKWTTSRAEAQRLLDRIAPGPCSTIDLPLPDAPADGVDALVSALENEHPSVDAAAVSHLVSLYGDRAERVLDLVRTGSEAPLDAAEPLFAAQATFAARFEMARSLEDLVLRRTTIGLLGPLPRTTLETLAGAMGEELGWDDRRRTAEVNALVPAEERA